MFNLFRRLLPREERFFDMYARHADTVLRGAEELRRMLDGGEAVRRHYPAVLAAEDEADIITREVVQAVRRTFVTPFDRGDIQALIGADGRHDRPDEEDGEGHRRCSRCRSRTPNCSAWATPCCAAPAS